MSGFTKGPWESLDTPLGGAIWVDAPDGTNICDLYHIDQRQGHAGEIVRKVNAYANASLIAAAPDLYEALSELLAATIADAGDPDEFPDDDGGIALCGDGSDCAVTFAIMRKARAALARVAQGG